MKFTILSHAGMLVESGETTLMLDPWLVGSCYWRSWWNYPKAAEFATHLDDLSFIYITHMHWDHFHGPSLRKLPPEAVVLIPQTHFKRMVKDVKDCGRKNIIELPHGKPLQLGPNLTVTSYQYGLATDSALMISDGKTTLADFNDCKVSGLPLRQVMKRHPKVDFLFRSHSSASPFPHCIDAEDPADLDHRSNEHYIEEFIEMAALVKPRYAIPFASNHCFLHKETFALNSTVVTPNRVKDRFDQRDMAGTECVVMVPGESWDDVNGFRLQQHDFFENREHHLAAYAQENAAKLDAYYETEAKIRPTFKSFSSYFGKFLGSLPTPLFWFFKPLIVFSFPGQNDRHWIVDFRQRSTYETFEIPKNYSFQVVVHPAVLKDCLDRSLFATFTASKRLRLVLPKGHRTELLVILQLLDMYEYEFFPIFKQAFQRRFIATWMRRWRELVEMVTLTFEAFGHWLKRTDASQAFVPKVK
jgi:UDP-MurNAc hydroxylase